MHFLQLSKVNRVKKDKLIELENKKWIEYYQKVENKNENKSKIVRQKKCRDRKRMRVRERMDSETK